MPRNRVEELESTVRELESTVEGLTEELVESKERIRVLEDLLDAEQQTRVPERRATEAREAGPDDVAAATAEADADPADLGLEADPEAEAVEEQDEPQESGTDEIIVA
ncbi:hypothetical protein Halru_1108 [Halovivax ruber XH-70]|uniref:Chromosome segregation protein SMC n=1 Tax=Halovivax ruber (strain DSM 18193 / JCM 13892 / XH-70) TaxID=797302 RepID=L0I803_HALRX|nr:hypothetical protein [Halovivax ruber]AGB15725.1 hypothetical protein Halru_1108 [Halovivax ruber XH-70]